MVKIKTFTIDSKNLGTLARVVQIYKFRISNTIVICYFSIVYNVCTSTVFRISYLLSYMYRTLIFKPYVRTYISYSLYNNSRNCN